MPRKRFARSKNEKHTKIPSFPKNKNPLFLKRERSGMSPGRAVLAILCFDPALEQVGALHQALCVPAKGMHAVW
ncbi:hypothetical protein AB434_3606 [Heyndrickxia coagulans]|nr:hypothetical protein AB434_3606 [Heyndrickxia coagulans]